jgi:hypothetical protein
VATDLRVTSDTLDPDAVAETTDGRGTQGAAPRSRRAILAAGLTGLAGAVAATLGRPAPAAAAPGSPLILGSQTNSSGGTDTQVLANSSVVTFKLLQQGPGTALMGYTTPLTGATRGVYGRVDSPNGYGIQGRSGAGSAGTGAAIQAIGVNNHGLDAATDNTAKYAVQAVNNASGTAIYASGGASGIHAVATGSLPGVVAESTNGVAVYGNGQGGVFGQASGESSAGVDGEAYGLSGAGVAGGARADSVDCNAIYGFAQYTNAFAGYFDGKVTVVGTLAKGGGSFRIDHPLDPAHRVLQHSFVESPDMLNIYNGVAAADARGQATVELPAWFMALNRDFRYQLTPIGEFAPLFVESEITDGRFTFAGAKPGQRVSWQVTGIRQDAWANANRIEVEIDKTGSQAGKYLHPEAHGKPASAGVDYARRERMMKGPKLKPG